MSASLAVAGMLIFGEFLLGGLGIFCSTGGAGPLGVGGAPKSRGLKILKNSVSL